MLIHAWKVHFWWKATLEMQCSSCTVVSAYFHMQTLMYGCSCIPDWYMCRSHDVYCTLSPETVDGVFATQSKQPLRWQRRLLMKYVHELPVTTRGLSRKCTCCKPRHVLQSAHTPVVTSPVFSMQPEGYAKSKA